MMGGAIDVSEKRAHRIFILGGRRGVYAIYIRLLYFWRLNSKVVLDDVLQLATRHIQLLQVHLSLQFLVRFAD